MLHSPTGGKRWGLVLLLSTIATLGPIISDMYLPSFPAIVEDLATHPSLVQLSLTTGLLGLAIGQPVIGSISDMHGRRKPLLVCLFLFALSSFLCAISPNITTLILARFVQGFTAAAGVVISRAIVRDMFSGKALTQFFALFMVITSVAPIIAPIAGGAILLVPSATWEHIFHVLGLVGLMIVLIAAIGLTETLPAEKRLPSTLKQSIQTMGELIRNRSFMGYALLIGFVQGGSFAYVAGTPFIYQDLYQVSPQIFSILFGINGMAIILGSSIIGRLSRVIHEQKLLQIAVLTAIVATLFLLIMTLIKGPLATLVISLFLYMTTIGMIMTSSFTLGMKNQEHQAGSASALLGTLPLVLGAAVSPLVSMNETTAVPMGVILFVTTLIGAYFFFALTRPQPKMTNSDS